jgi:hypothetical protein
MGQTQCAYLENILMDSFLSAHATQRSVYASGTEVALPATTLNELSLNLCSIDLIGKLSQQEQAAYQTMDQIFAAQSPFAINLPMIPELVEDDLKFSINLTEEFPEGAKSTKSDDLGLSNENTQENSTTTKLSAEVVAKKETDPNEFIKEERRKLQVKLQNSTDDKVIFTKRSKKLRKNAKHDDESYRGSRFWGVSRNKCKYQVMITLNHYKEYNGGFSSEIEAARVYDKKSICTFGLKAKTNFDYSKQEVVEILKNDCPIVL